MFRPRVIPILLLQNRSLVKTERFKNERYIGDPINAVKIFNDLKADAGTTLKVTGGTTQTVSSLTMAGSSGNLITLASTNTTPFIFSDSTGTNDCDYLD